MRHFITALALACVAASACADVVYTYTGNPLSTDPSEPPGEPGKTIAPLSIVLDFASDGSALLDWSVSQPDMGTISPADVYTIKLGQITDSPSIYFYTDATGAVTSWFINVEALDPTAPPGDVSFSKEARSWYGVVLGSPPLAVGIYAEEGANAGFNANAPGTWTATGGVLRDFAFGDRGDLSALPTPVPEPQAAWLLLAGACVVAMRWRTRRRG